MNLGVIVLEEEEEDLSELFCEFIPSFCDRDNLNGESQNEKIYLGDIAYDTKWFCNSTSIHNYD